MNISLRQMQYFIVVANEKSITRAAEILHISQPPLSRQIQQIEESLDTQLFVRSSRPLQLTKAGKVFYERAVHILSQIEQMKHLTRQAGKKQEETVSIGFVPSLLYGAFPHIIERLQNLHPHIEVRLIELLSSQQIDALKEGEIDIGFGRLRFTSKGISRLLLREERLMVAMSRHHPLAGPELETISIEALRGQKLILYPKDASPNFSDDIMSTLADYALNIENVQRVSQLQTALGLVVANAGISIVPESVRLSRPDLCYRLLGDKHLTSPILAYYRSDDDSSLLKVILNILTDIYQNRPSWMKYSTQLLTNDTLEASLNSK